LVMARRLWAGVRAGRVAGRRGEGQTRGPVLQVNDTEYPFTGGEARSLAETVCEPGAEDLAGRKAGRKGGAGRAGGREAGTVPVREPKAGYRLGGGGGAGQGGAARHLVNGYRFFFAGPPGDWNPFLQREPGAAWGVLEASLPAACVPGFGCRDTSEWSAKPRSRRF
jgi:hypothetical protein